MEQALVRSEYFKMYLSGHCIDGSDCTLCFSAGLIVIYYTMWYFM